MPGSTRLDIPGKTQRLTFIHTYRPCTGRRGERIAHGEGIEGIGSTSSSGIDTRDLTERRSDTDDDDGHGDPSPDNVDGTAANQRVYERRGQAVGDRGQHEGHEGDLGGRPVTLQLGLVAQVLEQVVGLVLGVGDTARAAGLVVHDASGVLLGEVCGRHGGQWLILRQLRRGESKRDIVYYKFASALRVRMEDTRHTVVGDAQAGVSVLLRGADAHTARGGDQNVDDDVRGNRVQESPLLCSPPSEKECADREGKEGRNK